MKVTAIKGVGEKTALNLIKEYGKAFGTDKFILDLRDFVNNDMVRRALPNKALAIRIDDIAKIFEET